MSARFGGRHRGCWFRDRTVRCYIDLDLNKNPDPPAVLRGRFEFPFLDRSERLAVCICVHAPNDPCTKGLASFTDVYFYQHRSNRLIRFRGSCACSGR